ncbi:SNF2-family ATP dependent chromatin remodeling factor snf21 [Lentinula boryana]|uniref:SNF2-family ATP dependent chromatin remodeling factor snf21 n=1 Tax=Lentinula boryana TaxID=40481 RepID=A0ABQ8QDM3_9AGAR|nr:SNF2-family ATP dependent chromatin remodeling factor snf21 [Lentinula boryana]
MSSQTSSACSSPPPSMLGTSVAPSSTAASSPLPFDLTEIKQEEQKLEDALEDGSNSIPAEEVVRSLSLSESALPLTIFQDIDARFERLNYVLEKSAIYSKLLKQEMDKANSRIYHQSDSALSKVKSQKNPSARRSKGRKRKIVESESESEEEEAAAAIKQRKISETKDDSCKPILQQPSLITGATLKPYQLDGLQWMASLHASGISGILADEMGLGKTLQTIAFSAHLREFGFARPFLIVCPLSVLHNWIDEYTKFAPDIPVCMYHGTPAERATLRQEVMRTDLFPYKSTKKARKLEELGPATNPGRGRGRTRGRGRKGFGSSRKAAGSQSKKPEQETEEGEGIMTPEEVERALKFPVVVTTYEMIIRDRAHLAAYQWGYIVVDEGHRLKNLDCTLTREIKKYPSASRMILTGTPLHNNLAELWSLLNFVLPDIFNDVDAFQSWFNIPTMQASLGNDRTARIIESLHAILKPFLLRRLKSDVETSLPPKKEYVLYAPLSITQREAYDKVLDGSLRAYLMQNKEGNKETPEILPEDVGPRKLRNQKNKGRPSYVVDEDDDVYFKKLEKTENNRQQAERAVDLTQLREAHQKELARKKVNNMKLQNTVMQLRKVCSHPFLFDWPLDPQTLQPILNDELVAASGKMMVLDRLLTELFKRKHKVLFDPNQLTTQDWARELKGWIICRIDGSSSPSERRDQMSAFQNGGDAPDAPHLFLLSTRAGGLGINLVAADTVIFYDQDWNPQMDAQAQDRAHRIGQTKPVLIYRLVSAHTIETKIMQRATEKRQLEALVIAKGKFRMPGAAAQRRGKNETIAEMAGSLLRLEGEKIDVVPNTNEGKANVLSDADLDSLLDRSPKVFAERGKGWTSVNAPGTATIESGKKAAFAVYEAPADEGNDALAMMLGEDN